MSQTVTRTDRLKAAHEKLQEAVQSIVTGEDWQRMLKVASKFHRYSFNNQLMIFCQRPDATLVAGFRRWQETPEGNGRADDWMCEVDYGRAGG